MKHATTVSTFGIVLAATLLGLATTTGCVGLVSNLIHAAKGNLVPPKYSGLEGKRVAVVCVSNSEAFGPSPIAPVLADSINKLLERNVKRVKTVDQQAIADWIDENDWDYLDYTSIGRAVGAESVVAVDLDSFSIYDDKTLYKGRADLRIVVYDVEADKQVFASSPPQVQYPKNTGIHTTGLTEREFRRRFLGILANRIARHFYAYDVKEDFAQDTTLIQ